MIKEDAKHALEELWGYDPEDSFYKIFKREAKNEGVYVILGLSKEDIYQLSCRDDSNKVVYTNRAEAGAIRTLWFCIKNSHNQGLYPDGISFVSLP